MTITRSAAQEILDVYIRAWEGQDADLICSIFTATATYHERVLQDPIPNREAIREYWETKVKKDQSNIKCTLLDFYIDPVRNTIIAEWEANFNDHVKNERKHMKEIAVLTITEDNLISSLREYWSSEATGPVTNPAETVVP